MHEILRARRARAMEDLYSLPLSKFTLGDLHEYLRAVKAVDDGWPLELDLEQAVSILQNLVEKGNE